MEILNTHVVSAIVVVSEVPAQFAEGLVGRFTIRAPSPNRFPTYISFSQINCIVDNAIFPLYAEYRLMPGESLTLDLDTNTGRIQLWCMAECEENRLWYSVLQIKTTP